MAAIPKTMKAIQNWRAGDTLYFGLRTVPSPEISDDAKDLIVKVEAAPVNPSDMGTLALAKKFGNPEWSEKDQAVCVKLGSGVPFPDGWSAGCGNEGTGVVVAGPASWVGKRVSFNCGQTYSEYCKTSTEEPFLTVIPEGISALEAASVFVNPLTACGFLDTMRAEKHSAIVHTAAGSQLGRMLIKLCKAEGVPLVNIVRSEKAAAELRALGAENVLISSLESFDADLVEACVATGATLGFDAIGGGDMAGRILTAMEAACRKRGNVHIRYGSSTWKQVYRYGGLDQKVTAVPQMGALGMAWGLGGWLMPFHFDRVGDERRKAAIQTAVDGLRTTFQTSYGRRVCLEDMVTSVDQYYALLQAKTGEKFLVTPNGPLQ